MSDADALVREIKVLISKGDKAKVKAEDFYIAAGLHLKTLKAKHDKGGGSWVEWEQFVKAEVGIGRSRASELMQIADGRKTLEEVNTNKENRRAKSIGKSRSSAGGGEISTTIYMPTVEEAEKSYQETIYDQACLFLESMTDATRQRLFAHIKENYHDFA